MNPDVEFFLYSGTQCRLCNDFLNELKKFLEPAGHVCHVINIDADPDLKQRYGARIPVLVAGNIELCEQFFDKVAVAAYLETRTS